MDQDPAELLRQIDLLMANEPDRFTPAVIDSVLARRGFQNLAHLRGVVSDIEAPVGVDAEPDPAQARLDTARSLQERGFGAAQDAARQPAQGSRQVPTVGDRPEDPRSQLDATIAGLAEMFTGGGLGELTGKVLSTDIGATMLGRPDLKGLTPATASALVSGSEERLKDARSEGFIGGQVAGSALPFAVLGRAAGIGRGGGKIVDTVGFGSTIPRRAATGALQLGSVGAAEDAILQIGQGEGSFRERVEDIDPLRLGISGGLAAISGVPAGTVAGVRQAERAASGGGERLGAAARDGSRFQGGRTAVEALVGGQERQVADIFSAARGTSASADLTDLVRTDKVLRDVLNRSDSQAGKALKRSFEKFESKKAGFTDPLSFEVADDLRTELQNVVSTSRSSERVRDAQRGIDAIDAELANIPGIVDARGLSVAADGQRAALAAGEKAASETAEVAAARLAQIKEEGIPGAARAFNEGYAEKFITRLEGSNRLSEDFLRNIDTPEGNRMLSVLMDGNEGAIKGFKAEVGRELSTLSAAQTATALKKWIGFAFFGSSVLADLLFGPPG